MKNQLTPDNAAMLLIDRQQGTIKLAANIDREALVHNTRALARTAVETGMPLVLTTSQEENFQGPLLDDLKEIAPEAYANRIKRPGIVDAWMFDAYREAVEATGRKKLIMAGLTNDVCIVYPAISATDTAAYVAAAVADKSPPNSALQVCGETASPNRLGEIVSEVAGKVFELDCLGSLDDLDAEITRRQTDAPDNPMVWAGLQYHRAMASGRGKLTDIANSRYPEIEPSSIAAFLKSARG